MVDQTIPGIRVDGHTPGPWKIVRHTSGPDQALSPSDDWSIVGPNAESIVFEGAGRKVARETEANARLIAAAPELLEALRPFLAAYLAYVNVMQNFVTSGETSAERRFSDGERQASAEEAAHEALAAISFEQLAAVERAIAKAVPPTLEGCHD